MKGHRSVCGGAMLSLVIILTLGVVIASAHDRVRTVVVDCNRGRTIAAALEGGNQDKPLVVIVQGICNENVVIDRDDVTLRGDAPGDGITGLDPTKDTILVEGARRVAFENLTVSGGGNGIAFVQGASGTVDSCAVQNTGVHGVRIEGASATVVNSTISSNHLAGIMIENGGNGRIGITNSNQYEGNTINSNGGDGIHVQYGATAAIGGNTITGNGTDPKAYNVIDRAGIAVYTATVVVVGGNLIKDNQGGGIVARNSNLRIGDPSFNLNLPTTNTISGNGIATLDGGVIAFVGTGLDIRYATITGNTPHGVMGVGSTVRIRNSHITNNMGPGIMAYVGTALDLQSTEVSGNTSFGVVLTTRSVGRIRGGVAPYPTEIKNNLNDGIRLVMGSGLFIEPTPPYPAITVSGNTGWGLNCADNESSYTNTFLGEGGTEGTVSLDCTGF